MAGGGGGEVALEACFFLTVVCVLATGAHLYAADTRGSIDAEGHRFTLQRPVAAAARTVEPWEGMEIRITENASQLHQAVNHHPYVGWTDNMAAYRGQTARVIRYDKTDRADAVLRVMHIDGAHVTWPISTVHVVGAEPTVLLANHPDGVRPGDQVMVASTPVEAEALAGMNPGIGWQGAMAAYCGRLAIVKRFDLVDRTTGTIRLLHHDGAVYTWPLLATMAKSSAEMEVHLHGADVARITTQKRKVPETALAEGEEVVISDQISELRKTDLPDTYLLRYAGRRATVKSVTDAAVVVTADNGKETFWPPAVVLNLRLSWIDMVPKEIVMVSRDCEELTRRSQISWSAHMATACGAGVVIKEASKAEESVVVVHDDEEFTFPIRALQPVLRADPTVGSVVAIPVDCRAVMDLVAQAWGAGDGEVDRVALRAQCGMPALVVPTTPHLYARARRARVPVIQLEHLDGVQHLWPVAVITTPSAIPFVVESKVPVKANVTAIPTDVDDAAGTTEPAESAGSAVNVTADAHAHAAAGGTENTTSVPAPPARPVAVGERVQLAQHSLATDGVLEDADVGVVVEESTTSRGRFLVRGPYGGTFWYDSDDLHVVVARTPAPHAAATDSNGASLGGLFSHHTSPPVGSEDGRTTGGRGGARGAGVGLADTLRGAGAGVSAYAGLSSSSSSTAGSASSARGRGGGDSSVAAAASLYAGLGGAETAAGGGGRGRGGTSSSLSSSVSSTDAASAGGRGGGRGRGGTLTADGVGAIPPPTLGRGGGASESVASTASSSSSSSTPLPGWSVGTTVALKSDWINPVGQVMAAAGTVGSITEVHKRKAYTVSLTATFDGMEQTFTKKFKEAELTLA